MTDKKEKELIEGCPWRKKDEYGNHLCQAVSLENLLKIFNHNPSHRSEALLIKHMSACTAPDCGSMYFARGELIKISASEKFMRDLLMKIQFENSEKMDEFLLFSPKKKTGEIQRESLDAELWQCKEIDEFLSSRDKKNTGEGDMPTTEPDGTTKATRPQEDTPSTEGTT